MASAKRAFSSWSDLPSDLLPLVLVCLRSLADRVRVGAVCRPWRSGARLKQQPPLPPPMPWIALGGEAFLDIVTDAEYNLRALNIDDDTCCCGSVDHLLFIMRDGGCFLADPFSGAVLPVADLAFFLNKEQTRGEMLSPSYDLRIAVKKVVGHWPQGSSAANPVVAALVTNSLKKHQRTIFVCRAGADTGVSKEIYSTMAMVVPFVKDIAFFRGNLYALIENEELVVVELGENSSGNPTISNVKSVIKQPLHGNSGDDEDEWCLSDKAFLIAGELYLVQSGDRLLMVRRWFHYNNRTSCFDVYEADLAASPCRWTQARSLHGRALFLARCGSKSVPAAGDDDGSEPQEDCIYFIRDEDRNSGVYNMWSDTIRQLRRGNNKEIPWRHWPPWIPTWVFFSDRSVSGS